MSFTVPMDKLVKSLNRCMALKISEQLAPQFQVFMLTTTVVTKFVERYQSLYWQHAILLLS